MKTALFGVLSNLSTSTMLLLEWPRSYLSAYVKEAQLLGSFHLPAIDPVFVPYSRNFKNWGELVGGGVEVGERFPGVVIWKLKFSPNSNLVWKLGLGWPEAGLSHVCPSALPCLPRKGDRGSGHLPESVWSGFIQLFYLWQANSEPSQTYSESALHKPNDFFSPPPLSSILVTCVPIPVIQDYFLCSLKQHIY